MLKTLAIICIVNIFTLASGQKIDVTKPCLGCICEATSNCNTTVTCAGDICGAFHITWGYWADSGKPTIDGQSNMDQNAYANCANDVYCAANSVTGYMEKYGKDCNNDGVVDCDDFARIHYLGAHGCTGTLESKYENRYLTCKKEYY